MLDCFHILYFLSLRNYIVFPKKEAEKWAQKMMRAMDRQLANNGEDFEKYYEGTGTTEKELMDEFIKEAEKQLKSRMVLYEIAREQNILEH